MTKTILFLLAVFMALHVSAQDSEYPYPSLSPKGTISQVVGNTTIAITYERPSVRKRQIFGGLVPWNKVWRTGAGYCTKISFDKSVIVGGQKVDAGKYALLTIPNEDEWIIILNKDTSQYGSYGYDPKKDAARFVVIPSASSRFYETLNFDIEIVPNNARIFLSWANVQISFEVKTTTDSEIEKLITTELLTKKCKESQLYAGAAEYLLYQGTNLSDAIKLVDFAIELDENNGWARDLKIKVYEKLKLYEDALSAVNQFIEHAKARQYEHEQDRENTLRQLKADHERISNLME